jgi:hypothetical protein
MVGPPEGGAQVVGLPFFLLTEVARDQLYRQIGVPTPADPSRGILAVRTLNCDRQMGQSTRAEKVRVEMLPSQPPAPAVPWVLSFGNQATKDLFETDDRGAAGFANLSPQSYTVRGIAPAPINSEEGTPYGTTLATVRPDTITIVEVREGQDLWGQ